MSTRYLIVTADDLGVCADFDEAILKAAIDGLVGSVEIMAPGPRFNEAAKELAAHPEIDVGIHLALTSEFKTYRWGPVLAPTSVPSLCGEHELLHADVATLARAADLDEVSRELDAQVRAVLAAGLAPTHVTQHYFCIDNLGRSPDAWEMLRQLCARYGLAARVTNVAAAHWLTDRGIHTVHQVPTTTHGFAPDAKLAAYSDIIRGLPPGISELVVHPAYDRPSLVAISPSGPRRQRDLELMLSDELRVVMAQSDVEPISWARAREILATA
jgi:predicted glycoside hydrolase/deacetylase ChbG (UPF0249 family)